MRFHQPTRSCRYDTLLGFSQTSVLLSAWCQPGIGIPNISPVSEVLTNPLFIVSNLHRMSF